MHMHFLPVVFEHAYAFLSVKLDNREQIRHTCCADYTYAIVPHCSQPCTATLEPCMLLLTVYTQ